MSKEQLTFQICLLIRNVTEEIHLDNKDRYWFYDNLGGYCAIASYGIHLGFSRNNISHWFVMGCVPDGGHCRIEDKDKVYDVTATQFGETYPRVLIQDKKKCTIQFKVVDAVKYPTEINFTNWMAQNPFRQSRWTQRYLKELIKAGL
jgi:hypothetical protein